MNAMRGMFKKGALSAGLRVQVALLLLVSIQAADSQTIYSAVSAALSNGASSVGGGWVGNLGGPQNGTVTFDVKVQHDGLYPLTVGFNGGDDRALTVTVNEAARFDVIFHPVAADGKESSQTVLVPLSTGDNSIAFNNALEPGPNLREITVAGAPVQSCAVSGSVLNADGAPRTGVTVLLSSGETIRMKTTTDQTGHYQFPFVPHADYYVRPSGAGDSAAFFSPCEKYCPLSEAAQGPAAGIDFVATPWGGRSRKISVMRQGKWRIEYDLSRGVADVFYGGQLLIPRAFAEARMPEVITSMDFQSRKMTHEPIQDRFGRGEKFVVESSNNDGDTMRQTFRLYKNSDYFLADMEISRKGGAASNFMSPLVSDCAAHFLAAGDDRALFVPFDNDKWVRYDAVPFGGQLTSYEVSAFYNNADRHGLVIGSVTHDTWKTGIESATTSNRITRLEIFGGISSSQTRDVLPHGKVRGATIRSPSVFIGYFSDWRDGLDAYGRANAMVASRRPWHGGPPFGWNSWGKLQFSLTFQKATEVSDFFATQLPHFEEGGAIYIGLDAGWDFLSDEQLKQFVEHCRSNHQAAGVYFTPFTAWGPNGDAPVPGTPFKYRDVFLYAHGHIQHIAGGVALDPTHPGTQALIKSTLERFHRDGFQYVKADFLNYGTLEADKYFDTSVTTGVEAYNEGMKFVDAALGQDMYLNESIAPLFPAQYANSRRIGCDSFGSIQDTEYTLNSLTYGWWLSQAYDFNDPDEMVLDGFSEGENRARVTSAAITGLFISGDDFSKGGSATGKERAREFLNNAAIDQVARSVKSFRTVEGNTGSGAANVFSCRCQNDYYLAAFNYSTNSVDLTVDLRRAGIKPAAGLEATELWSGATSPAANPMTITLGPSDAALYKFSRRLK